MKEFRAVFESLALGTRFKLIDYEADLKDVILGTIWVKLSRNTIIEWIPNSFLILDKTSSVAASDKIGDLTTEVSVCEYPYLT